MRILRQPFLPLFCLSLVVGNLILAPANPLPVRAAAIPSAISTTIIKPPQFVQLQGNDLVLGDQPIKLKGHNFYPYQNAWAAMWQHWNGPEIKAEVGQAAILGDNVLRILIPYGTGTGWNDSQTGKVDPVYLAELGQMAQIASSYGMKLIVTLFDFYDGWPAANTPEETANLTYLQTIVGAFSNDDRILAWDLHNEPDYYARWAKQNQPDPVLDWTARMRQAILQVDPNHLITVGVGFYEDIWYTDSLGRSFASLSDYISLHSYNALDFGNEIYHIREHTSKPILLEETGWPTGPVTHDPHFTEAEQLKVYQLATATVAQQNLIGMLGWVLRDQLPDGLISPDDNQYYYGIERRNGTLKPAALVFRQDLKVSPLPSTTTTALPLSSQTGEDLGQAEYFPQTDHYVPTPLKELWRRAGGEAVFGLPLTEAFVDKLGSDGTASGPGARIVQYFERARFEYYPARLHEPDFKKYSHLDKYFYIVDFGKLGQELGGSAINSSPRIVRRQADGNDYLYFDATGHDLAPPFLGFWNAHYGSKIFGAPISQATTDDTSNQSKRIVQYFENARLEYDPSDPSQTVTVTPLGRAALVKAGIPIGPPPDLATGSFADPAFAQMWRQVDQPVQDGDTSRSWLWGPTGFAVALEPYTEADHSGWRLVEYFDKSRMEITYSDRVSSGNKYFVTNGLLVKEMISGQMQVGDHQFETHSPAQIAIAGDPSEVNPLAPTYASWQSVSGGNAFTTAVPFGQPVQATLDKAGLMGQLANNDPLAKLASQATYIEATGHNIPDVFWHYLTFSQGPLLIGPGSLLSQGDVLDDWLYSVGLPISEAYWVHTRVDGVDRTVLVQAFERRVLTFTPNNPPAYQVEMGNVGRHYYQWRYSAPQN